MLTEKEKMEHELLNILTDSQDPMGSVTLSLLLKERDLDVSGATVGRMLSEFDHKGHTIKHGYKGRVLTQRGFRRLDELKTKQRISEFSSRFYESIDAESRENLISVLTARRGIERESARLAATRATEEDMADLKKVYKIQRKDAVNGIISSDNDVLFHQAIARASKNKVLAAAYDFIWQNGKLSPVMEYIRTSVGGTISVDHGKILEALIVRDPDLAEKRMMEHIDSLIIDVNNYWSQAEIDMRMDA